MSSRKIALQLIVLGGVIGLILAVISILSVSLMADVLGYGYVSVWQYAALMGRFGMIGYPEFGGDLNEIMLSWGIMSMVGALLAIYGGFRAVRSATRNSHLLAMIGGVLLLMSFSWIPAFMVIVGCLILIL